MKPAFVTIMAVTLCWLWSHEARAQTVTPDAELAQGEHIARFVCATCHVVAMNQKLAPMLSTPTPSFFDIANRPGVTAESLEHFVSTTHWDPDRVKMTMPALMLSQEHTRAVTRYILSLRKR